MVVEKIKFDFHTKIEKRDDIDKNKVMAYQNSLEEWVAFWRENPHRFAQDYFQIKLKDFQEMIIYEFSKNRNNIMIATRGIGKSFLTALYACTMAVLYPNSKIVIVCGVKSQAKTFIAEKIEKELCGMSIMLRKEIKEFKTESEFKTVIFKNGSSIMATNAGSNRRGLRATMLIVDEAVQVDKQMIEAVCLPFLNAVRYVGYRNTRKYKNHVEERENQAIYLTSAWFKAHFFYNDYYTTYIKEMLRGGSARVFNFSYETPLRTHLLPQSRVDDMISTMDKMTFEMEVKSIFYGENGDSFFKADEINSCRTLSNVYYPPTIVEYLNAKNSGILKYPLKKKKKEIRILSADIALSAGKRNDNSIYSLFSLDIKKNNTFKKKLRHLEAHNGLESEKQALRIKQLFYDFECNRAIIDAHGIGMAVYNELKKETIDTERGVTYPAWEAYNETSTPPEMSINKKEYVMYAMKATGDINHEIALGLKNDLLSYKIELPQNDVEIRKELEKVYGFSGLSGIEQARIILPFKETNILFKEMIDLDYMVNKGKIQIKEQGSNRKDRYSSVGYGNYLCNKIIEEFDSKSSTNVFLFLT